MIFLLVAMAVWSKCREKADWKNFLLLLLLFLLTVLSYVFSTLTLNRRFRLIYRSESGFVRIYCLKNEPDPAAMSN